MKNNDFNDIFKAPFFYKKEKNLEFYFSEKETCIFIAKLDKKGEKNMLYSPEKHYKFVNLKIENDLLFLGVKGEIMTSFIYSLKKNSFLENPITKNKFSFYPFFLKGDNYLEICLRGNYPIYRKFCILTHSFLNY